MTLNKTSYVHVQIRLICKKLEALTAMKLLTDFKNEFDEIVLLSDLCYIVVDWRNQTCCVLSHRLTAVEFELVKDLILYLSWLDTGEVCNKNVIIPKELAQ